MALLLLSPAAIVPAGLDRFVFGKLLVAAVGLAVAALAPARGRLPRLVQGLLVVACVLTLLSAVLSPTPEAEIFGRQPLSEGVLVLAVYLLAGISGARLLGPARTERTVHIALCAMAICALLVAVLAVLESVGLRPLSTTADRPGSLLGNASDEGAFAVLYAAPLVCAAVRRRDPLLVTGAAASIAVVVLSASRGALVALVVVLVLLLARAARPARKVVLGTLGAAAVLAFAVPATRRRILGESPLAAHTSNGRDLLWHETLHLLTHHWWLGVGPSGFENAIVGEHTRSWQVQVGPDNPPGSPHNWILQTLVVGGPILLVVLLALLALTCRGALRAASGDRLGWNGGAVLALAGFAVALLFHFPSPGTAIPAALLAGSLLAIELHPRPSRRWVAWGTAAVAGALSFVFVFAAIAEIELRAGEDDVGHGRYAAADTAFDAARMLRPWDVDLPGQALHAFVAQVAAGDKSAVPYARRWSARVGAAGDDEQLDQNRAALLQATGEYPQALRILDAQLRRDPYDPQLLLLRGVTRAEAGDLPGAARDLQAAAAIDRSDPAPWHDLALIYRARGETAAALAAERHAARLSTP